VIDETNFIPDLPRLRLTALPTPLDRASRLEAALRDEGVAPPRIYIKRDDLLSLAFGGNKIRNLEFSLGAARADGATDIVTIGRAQSNHCRLTAAACARAGLRAHLVMSGERPALARGNLLLSELFGAAVHFTGTEDRGVRDDTAARIRDDIAARGGRPVMLPPGGSDARGAVGHVIAAQEIVLQCEAIGEQPNAIVVATATGGTQAGLIAGLLMLAIEAAVYGFTVHRSVPDASLIVKDLANRLGALLGIDNRFEGDAILMDESQLGRGYGVPSAAGQAAIGMLARTEGLLADPVYTGKALAGLLAMVRAGSIPEDSSVVFIHTGGTPALFADLAASAL
jgi:1-aminocyclopropane-1-carboxylate deaminase/D-cysteine desulfhydrase-like pyridoxal-dependent ACC family enzyme